MRLANPSQRCAMSKGKVRVLYTNADNEYILSASGSILGYSHVQALVEGKTYVSPDEKGVHPEARIGVVRREIFKELRKVARKHFDVGGILIAYWCKADGGRGWVEMTL